MLVRELFGITEAAGISTSDIKAWAQKHGMKDIVVEKRAVMFTYKNQDFMVIPRGKTVDVTVNGYKDSLVVDTGLDLSDLLDVLKTVNKKWYKENDPHFSRGE
jgi:hypothetical protein